MLWETKGVGGTKTRPWTLLGNFGGENEREGWLEERVKGGEGSVRDVPSVSRKDSVFCLYRRNTRLPDSPRGHGCLTGSTVGLWGCQNGFVKVCGGGEVETTGREES